MYAQRGKTCVDAKRTATNRRAKGEARCLLERTTAIMITQSGRPPRRWPRRSSSTWSTRKWQCTGCRPSVQNSRHTHPQGATERTPERERHVFSTKAAQHQAEWKCGFEQTTKRGERVRDRNLSDTRDHLARCSQDGEHDGQSCPPVGRDAHKSVGLRAQADA